MNVVQRHQSIMRTRTAPIEVRQSVRMHEVRVRTTMKAGYMMPLAVIPVLREDAIGTAQVVVNVEMNETVDFLMNAVNLKVSAYLVPFLAFERFGGSLDLFNKSYNGLPLEAGKDVVPFFDTATLEEHGENEILKYLGKHVKQGGRYNTAYTEAYNLIWNHRARNRSNDLTLRVSDDMTLAPAFWLHDSFAHIVPEFDQASADGAVPLNVIGGKLAIADDVGGTKLDVMYGPNAGNQVAVRVNGGTSNGLINQSNVIVPSTTPAIAGQNLYVELANMRAELEQNGITVSLSNIELARKTQAFARLRKMFTGHDDEYIIDMLMSGISIPDQMWKHPILLSESRQTFGMSKRYASDGSSLTESVVNGLSSVEMRIRTPRVPTGGIVMIVAEVTPEQLFERQKDPMLHAFEVSDLPEFLRDELDPEKVAIVTNDYVDVDHDTPNATFGFAPLNHEWNHAGACVGGDLYRPEVDGTLDEVRQSIWAVETVNPTLSTDFYLCTNINEKPFYQAILDNFQVLVRGRALISGNTVFGPMLIEGSSEDYEKIMEKAPQERIEQGA